MLTFEVKTCASKEEGIKYASKIQLSSFFIRKIFESNSKCQCQKVRSFDFVT